MAARRRSSARSAALKRIKGTSYSVKIDSDVQYDTESELDWNSLGNIMTRYLENDVMKASRVDFRYGTGSQRSRKPTAAEAESKTETDWEYSHNKYDIMVFKRKLRLGSPITCWMGRGVINVPLRNVAEFIKDVQNNMTWDDLLIEATYLKVVSGQSQNPVDFLGYQRFEKTTCFVSTQRDLLYFVRCHYKGNKYVQSGFSVDDPNFPPPQGVKRIEARLGSGWVMEPYQGDPSKTLVTYVANTDLKGLPIFVMNHVLRRHPLALYYVRMQLLSTAVSHSKSSVDETSDDEETGFSVELRLSKSPDHRTN